MLLASLSDGQYLPVAEEALIVAIGNAGARLARSALARCCVQ